MTGHMPPPSPEVQLAFLAKLQRLFAEGDFTATYKFALLIALADLAVERGRDDGGRLTLTIRDVAERFVGLYWRHTLPYGHGQSGAESDVLVQNIGTQAAVVSAIAEFRHRTGLTNLSVARTHPEYPVLISRVAKVVSAQPLKYLQNFGGSTDPFLYERGERGHIHLQPGMSYCLRRFYPLVQQLCQSHWVGHIKANKRNHPILGGSDDLEDFLFSTSRQSLQLLGSELHKLDGDRCFYCGHRLNEWDVDHFVPHSLYPRDLAGNFVLAHPSCNRSKSDTLAAREHLGRWLERLDTRGSQLQEIGLSTGMPADLTTVHRVASWAYANGVNAKASAWQKPALYEAIDDGYLQFFAHT